MRHQRRRPDDRGGSRGRASARPGDRLPAGDRGAQGPPRAGGPKIDPFELFCAYHLGIGPDKSYRPANIHDVARRFGVDAGVIRQTLQAYGMDPEALIDTEFDITMAQMDIQVAPPGIDRMELAKPIFEEFRKAPRKKRNWQQILSEDARENAKIFDKKN